jgi:hypothetical protein
LKWFWKIENGKSSLAQYQLPDHIGCFVAPDSRGDFHIILFPKPSSFSHAIHGG